MKIENVSGELRDPLLGVALHWEVLFLLIHHATVPLELRR
jgi:hypothetical protein